MAVRESSPFYLEEMVEKDTLLHNLMIIQKHAVLNFDERGLKTKGSRDSLFLSALFSFHNQQLVVC